MGSLRRLQRKPPPHNPPPQTGGLPENWCANTNFRSCRPTNDWKLQRIGEEIFPGEVYQAGIGQGYDAVTPIQLINAYAALANGGRLYEPRIVRDIVDAEGNVVVPFEPSLIRELDVPDGVLKEMREAARSTVTIRHTYNLVDLPLVIAGKSGTAEFGLRDSKGRLPFHSWFVGFTPKDAAKKGSDPNGLDRDGD